MTYAIETDIEAMMGFSITTNSRPTSTELASLLSYADSIINAEARVTSNLTDTSGRLKTIACSLVHKMITNIWANSDPDMFGFVEIELTEDQKRIIHVEHSVWQSLTWDVGN